jgi:uncharacterized membrane protein YdbT with pleckstrin-like domain
MSIQIPKDMSLTEGEIPIWFGQMSWVSKWFWIFIAIICLLTRNSFLIVIAIFIAILVAIDVLTSEYFISNKRIYFKRGLISRVLNDIKIEWITNIFVQQGIFGRILNYGDIGISSPGERSGAIGFIGVSDPMKIKAIIEDTLTKYKKNQ